MSDTNVVCVSGVHGVGKSTLIRALCKDTQHFIASKKIRVPKPDEIRERQLVRACRFYLQNFYEQSMAKQHAGKAVLCDRGWQDMLAYAVGFAKLGWMPSEEYKIFSDLSDFLFQNTENKILFLNPPLESIEQNLQKRWEKGRKKWREDDFDYLYMVYESYQFLIPSLHRDYLEIKETGLQERVNKVYEWLHISQEVSKQSNSV